MIAVVKTGGKQYKISEGDVIQVEKLDGQVGETINLDKVLMSESRLNGDYDLKLSNGASIRLSRTFVKSFKSKYLGTSA